MVVCPTCGRDEFNSHGSMKSHHTRVHNFKLDVFESEREWLLQSEDIEWSDDNIDRFVAQVNREIRATAEKFDLEAGSEL